MSGTSGIPFILAFFVPLTLMTMMGRPYIRFLKQRYMGQYIREDGPQSHHKKAGTPTAGGVLIVAAFIAALLPLYFIRPEIFSPPVLGMVAVVLIFGLMGFVDDYLKISKKKNKGLSGYGKLAIQISTGLALGYWMMSAYGHSDVSLFGLATIPMGWFYPVFTAFVITGASNSVNLTDGLDGLASSTAVVSLIAFALILENLALPGADMLTLASHALAGATLGFLVFNRYPAKIFMGDTGSLALGGAIGYLAIWARMEFWLVLLAAIFIVEALSVILQVISFKSTGKRIFRMSPLHHHFELGGWRETKVVFSFLTFQFLCCALAVFLYNRG